MMTIKDLYKNEELLNNIVEDIDDLPEDTKVLYCVWALGYNEDKEPTDTEVFVGEFENPDRAIEVASKLTIETLDKIGYNKIDKATASFSIEVETAISDPDDEDCGTMNIGTIYRRALWIDGEYGSEEDAPDYDEDIVTTCAGDYELLEDGTLKLSAKFMKGFNKNDIIRVQFIDENSTYPLPYKIISKVEYADGDYYHCEFMI